MTAGQAAGGRPLPVTVVIPTFNRAADLPRSIGSLAAQRGTGLRVIVVDNSSSDPTEEVIRSLQPAWEGRLDYVRKEPQGPASARNRGLAAATTPYVMFMDSDVEVPPDWIPNALAHLEADPSLAAAGGLILYAFDPTRVNAYGGDLGVSGLAWDVEEGTLREVARRPEDRIWINCSAMLVRTEALRRVDGFDEAYFYGYEDSDVGWRLNLAGERVAVFPPPAPHGSAVGVGRRVGRGKDVLHRQRNSLERSGNLSRSEGLIRGGRGSKRGVGTYRHERAKEGIIS